MRKGVGPEVVRHLQLQIAFQAQGPSSKERLFGFEGLPTTTSWVVMYEAL